MEDLFGIMAFFPTISVINILTVIFSLLFMHFSAQQRNHKLSLSWYVCGVIFGVWTVLVFLLKRKDFPGENFKVCEQCGSKYPVNYEICSRCLMELPKINPEEKEKQKKLSKFFGTGIIITEAAALIIGVVIGVNVVMKVTDMMLNATDRIAVNGVFYDKMGNSYENETDVLLYDEKGRTYTYTVEEITDDENVYFDYEQYYYVREDGEKYYLHDCYVTEEGWFYCDKGGFIEYYYPDTENMSEEELDAFYKEQMELDKDGYKYYNDYYVDKEGNIYYDASLVSWNEKGELITAENDIYENE